MLSGASVLCVFVFSFCVCVNGGGLPVVFFLFILLLIFGFIILYYSYILNRGNYSAEVTVVNSVDPAE